MAQAERVYRRNECSRVMAISNPDGSVTIEVRHDGEIHGTTIAVPALAPGEGHIEARP